MTTLATPTDFAKEYMPGYTGHVPTKNERFGNTAGQIQNNILKDKGRYPTAFDISSKRQQNIYGIKQSHDQNKIVHGNHSRFAKNWTCGPTHMINEQRLPGYTGHIKGLQSENLYSQTFGESTQKAFTKRHPVGHDL